MAGDLAELKGQSLRNVLLHCIENKGKSIKAYNELAESVKNSFLKEKFLFLAKEEGEQEVSLKHLLERHCQGIEPGSERHGFDSFPPIDLEVNEEGGLPTTIQKAMVFELASRNFYFAAVKLLPNDAKVNDVLLYFASIEWAHYELLKSELDHATCFGDHTH